MTPRPSIAGHPPGTNRAEKRKAPSVSGGALGTIYLRRLLSAHVSRQPRSLRAVVRHGEGSSHRNPRKVVHERVSTRGWASCQAETLTKCKRHLVGRRRMRHVATGRDLHDAFSRSG